MNIEFSREEAEYLMRALVHAAYETARNSFIFKNDKLYSEELISEAARYNALQEKIKEEVEREVLEGRRKSNQQLSFWQ